MLEENWDRDRPICAPDNEISFNRYTIFILEVITQINVFPTAFMTVWIPKLFFCGFVDEDSYCIGLTKVGGPLDRKSFNRHEEVVGVIKKNSIVPTSFTVIWKWPTTKVINFSFSQTCYDDFLKNKEIVIFLRYPYLHDSRLCMGSMFFFDPLL